MQCRRVLIWCRLSSLSVDYTLTLVLAALLAVKYVLFDHDDHNAPVTTATVTAATTTMATVTTATVPATSAAPETKSSFVVGQLEQIDEVADEALHSESAGDITPTGSSLAAGVSHRLTTFVDFISLFSSVI